MGSIPKILPFFMEITVNTSFKEEYPLRFHVPSEDTSISATALVVLTNLLIIICCDWFWKIHK